MFRPPRSQGVGLRVEIQCKGRQGHVASCRVGSLTIFFRRCVKSCDGRPPVRSKAIENTEEQLPFTFSSANRLSHPSTACSTVLGVYESATVIA
jgi:hypothetical protein